MPTPELTSRIAKSSRPCALTEMALGQAEGVLILNHDAFESEPLAQITAR